MDSVHNFLDTQKIYFESRKIPIDLVQKLISLWNIKMKQETFEIAIKDLEWNIVGWQERVFLPIKYKDKEIVSTSLQWSKQWFFIESIDYASRIIIVLWELDFLVTYQLENIIGLQDVNLLSPLISSLKTKGVSDIYLFLNSDCEDAVSKVLDCKHSLDNVFYCKDIMGSYSSIISYLHHGDTISWDYLEREYPSLESIRILFQKFMIGKNKLDHNEFAKYLIHTMSIASTQDNLFMYNCWDSLWIWKQLDKTSIERIIVKKLEMFVPHFLGYIKQADYKWVLDFMIVQWNSKELKERLSIQEVGEINLRDGILDLESMKIRDYTKEDYKFQKLPYSKNIFDDSKKPEKFLLFLNEILDGLPDKEEIVSFLQEYIGYLFIPSAKFEKSLLLYWPWWNGKSVLLDVVVWILWRENCSSIGLNEINNTQYLYNLIGKLANIDHDMQQNVQLDSWVVKKLISWESVSVKMLYKQPIEFIPYAKLLFGTNELPHIKSIDNAIRRRFVFLPLKNSFLNKPDPDLKYKLLGESSQIFVRAIDGLKRLLNRWKFAVPKCLEDEIENFIKDNDSVELFFHEDLVISSDQDKITYADIYFLYKSFCNESWYKALGKNGFNKRVKSRGFDTFHEATARWFVWLKRNTPF